MSFKRRNLIKINVIAENEKVEISNREKQIIHVALLNILALLNAIITQKGMVSNPIEDDSENLGYEVYFETNLSAEEKNEFIRRVTNQVGAFLKMSEVPYVVEEGFTKEDLEAIEEMSEEEFADFINNQPIYEEPLYAIDFIEATKDEIILEYEGERETFTALSETYFEREDGMRYVIEYDSSIEDYQNSFMDY